jgi:hypothetical protein
MVLAVARQNGLSGVRGALIGGALTFALCHAAAQIPYVRKMVL